MSDGWIACLDVPGIYSVTDSHEHTCGLSPRCRSSSTHSEHRRSSQSRLCNCCFPDQLFEKRMTTTESGKRRRLVGVSTKMYFDLAKSKSYLDAVLSSVPSLLAELREPTDVFVIPDFVNIIPYAERIAAGKAPLLLGAQDAHHDDGGAYTGEVSPKVLAQAGVKIVEMGHAERRRLFGETDEWVAQKALGAARNAMVPLICVGEVSQGGGAEKAVEECWTQVYRVFENPNFPKDAEVILAYEPVWAIGKSEPASAEHVVAVTKLLRQKAADLGRPGLVRILYGGSAGPGLFQKLEEGVDGLFLGRFAHDPKQFVETITEVGGGRK
ncbi:Triosephosphate isomerase [Acaromyces ingoldii]|uniref:Triosephosphate isomerase n=1 Tax=Acaromyces ingoldii TaxID=215250 RepID=A0A316YXD8_9BASI|nr:Triosephosphate isomerase [Acaromyces ingoldii]PWN93414.1 Triosephosphate isomerase [Acaromyces ingoldii]